MTQDYLSVPYGKSVHGEEEIAAVVEVLRNSTLMGKNVREMEARVAALFAKKWGIMVNSGTSANYLAVELLNLPPGTQVITPVLTFSTTVAPLIRNKLIPVFIDVSEGTYNIDVNQIENMITPKTKAMMIPNLIGNLSDWDILRRIADQYHLALIEDSADTLGALLRNESTGTRSDISTTSFYGSHVINCAGNGGMLCVNNPDYEQRAKLLRSWGRSSSLFVESEKIENRFNVDLEGIGYDAKFVFAEAGYNLEPSEMGAAFGLVQLSKLPLNIKLREQNFQKHLDFFKDYEDWFILPKQMPDSVTGWLAMALTVKDTAPFTRKKLQIYFEERGIQTRPIFTGNILRQPGFKQVECIKQQVGYPVADAVMRGGILIGCHHGLTEEMLGHIHNTFKKFVASL
jgi:CDP-6-deoxy-D-xylo-4-hexulose-3-dehydrase